MTLPGAVLFPGSMLPLYIFEPRYRQMLADALSGRRMFAIVGTRGDSDDAVCDVGGAGLVRACVANADGTSRLILQGVERVRLLDWMEAEPYPLARVEVLKSRSKAPEVDGELRLKVRRQCVRVLKGSGNAIGKLLDATPDHGEFSDFVGANLVDDPVIRQNLIEEIDTTRRLEVLASYLTEIGGSK